MDEWKRRGDEEREVSVVPALGICVGQFSVSMRKTLGNPLGEEKVLFGLMVSGFRFEGSVGHIALGLC